jgi:3alpha(or 20beta)-hydroxysteroid dehydrogenase
MGRVADKVVLITGGAGAKGMGAASARMLIAEGAKVVIGDVLDEQGQTLVAELGDTARYVHLDVTSGEDWTAAVETTVAEFGKLNVLVNNAGIVQAAPLKTADITRWQKVLDVNLTGAMRGIQAVIAPMIAAGGGSIINISSIEGMRGAVWMHSYVASKWGLRGLTKSAALELAPEKIRVNSIHPGFIRTAMTKHLPDDIVKAPMGRAGTPEEVAPYVVFLASDESSFSTGSEYVVDGGLITDVPHRA